MQSPNPARPSRHIPFQRPTGAYRLLIENQAPIKSCRNSSLPPATAIQTPQARESAASLAARLAVLFDQYMVYRPEMLSQWDKAAMTAPQSICNGNQAFGGAQRRQSSQPTLPPSGTWPGKWPIAFRTRHCLAYHSINVFGVSMMPKVYLWFSTNWQTVWTPTSSSSIHAGRQFIQPPRRQMSGFRAGSNRWCDVEPPPNMLLASLGKGNASFMRNP